MIRTYTELSEIEGFMPRYEYLRLNGVVGHSTFGFDRYLNQNFYRSREWRDVRNYVILRDNGCDLGVPGYELQAEILIHHINPMESVDLVHGRDWILDPEYLITTCTRTHNAIHYGPSGLPRQEPVQRRKDDTIPWRSTDEQPRTRSSRR